MPDTYVLYPPARRSVNKIETICQFRIYKSDTLKKGITTTKAEDHPHDRVSETEKLGLMLEGSQIGGTFAFKLRPSYVHLESLLR